MKALTAPGVVMLVLSGLTTIAFADLARAAGPASVPASTLANLQAAYNGESNANAKYLKFAERADEEGYGAAASLFRAAARAEAIHAANHAAVIKKLGAKPAMAIELPKIGTTAENLAAAIAGESYERDTMYPDFIKLARQDGNADAVRTFNLAKTAEAEHAKLYAAELKALKDGPSKAKTYFVCSVCGWTAAALPSGKCPSCFSPVEKFEQVK